MTIMSEGRQSSVDDFGLSGYDEYEEASVSLTPFPKLKRDMRTLRSLRNPASAGDLTKRAVRRFQRFLYGYQENAIKVFDLRRPLPPCQKTTDLVLRRMTAEDLDHLDS